MLVSVFQHLQHKNIITRVMSSVPLSPAAFFEAVRDTGIAFYCGVPDSLLKGILTVEAPRMDIGKERERKRG